MTTIEKETVGPESDGAMTPRPVEVTHPMTTDAGNIDKIRDILFGSQVKAFSKKMARLEERLVKANADLKEDTKNRLDALESYIKSEIESIGDRLKSENRSRVESERVIHKDLKEVIETFDKKIGQTEEQLADNARNFRDQILNQSKSLSDDMENRSEQTSRALEKIAQELRDDKVDRSALSDLFAELSMRLSDASPLSSLLEAG